MSAPSDYRDIDSELAEGRVWRACELLDTDMLAGENAARYGRRP